MITVHAPSFRYWLLSLVVCAFVVGNKTTIYFDVRRSVNRPIPNARRAIRSTCNALKRRLKLIFRKEFLNVHNMKMAAADTS